MTKTEYSEKTQKWLQESWDIDIATNDKNLEKIEAGELTFVSIGCDTGNMNIKGCYEQHEKYKKTSYSGYITTCQICNNCLKELHVINVFNPVRKSIEFYLDTKEANEAIEKQIKIEDGKIEQVKKKQELENQKMLDIIEKAKKTGIRQLISEWSEECNSPNEECDIDNVRLYIMPDGTKKIERNHTW